VDIAVNGKSVPFNMKIGEAGEAFFVFETDSDVPDDLITSPLLEPTEPISTDALPAGEIGRFGAGDDRQNFVDDGARQEPDFLDLDAPSTEGLKTSASKKNPDVEKLDEAHSRHFMKDVPAPQSTETGGMSRFTFLRNTVVILDRY
jgi:phosphatidate phosphatase PAH1